MPSSQRTFSHHHPQAGSTSKTFERRRAELIANIANSLKQFSSVEALWSNFENVIAKEHEENMKENTEKEEGVEKQENSEKKDGNTK
ncbi:hypothetical protein BDP81DRAFT_400783 [Colletotrichum phormii]|uniref:DASH complex subunit DAD1 n=1 Tax=Colletotrichum phormii TaxID=359342 RepID=A0AAI9ZE20_9PEZI|nr:uncharacterized protein BDP81DRAFT_400783 [Colletotrichum phormii]KAK1621880.1 hypothetical protein BDP81DRAFT_400783 [Colletotrichum phormii]